MIRVDKLPQMPEAGWSCRCPRCERIREYSRQIMATRAAGLELKAPPGRQQAPVRCGTPSGYTRHIKKREAACEACKAAKRGESADRRAAAKAERGRR